MKNITKLIALIILAAILHGCDYVVPTVAVSTPPVDTTAPITSIIIDSTTTKTVLIEDYTGHKCGNCPHAADRLDSIIQTYGDSIIPIAVHAGFFAWPDATGNYTTDFQTTVGTAWDTYFGMSAAGNPQGCVNRLGYPGNFPASYNSWAGTAAYFLGLPHKMNIKITNVYRGSKRSLTTTISSKYLTALDSTYKLSVVVTEDSVIDHQDFYYPTTHDDPTYVFKHILRASLNSTWGDTLSSGSQPMNSVFTKTYSLDLSSTKIKVDKNCHVVAFIYNAATYEVVQAEMATVTK